MTERTKERGTYLGGQQIAAVLGLHPYMSIGDVFIHSTQGRQKNEDWDDDDWSSFPGAIRRGMILEPGLCDYVEQQRKLDGSPNRFIRDVFVEDPDVPFYAGTLDLVEIDDNDRIVVVHELTGTTMRMADKWGPDGSRDPMAYKWIQCLWYMGISGAPQGFVWALFADSRDVRRYPVDRNPEALSNARTEGERFWLDHVVTNTPPTKEDMEKGGWGAVADSLNAIYGFGDGGELSPNATVAQAALEYTEANEREKEAKDAKRAASAKLKLELRDHTMCRWEGGTVHWKNNKPRVVVDKDAVINQLAADVAAASGEHVEDIIGNATDKHTTTKPGPRVLRVYIKKEKEDDQEG